MIYREFYKELGNLLYAVAKADGKVNDKELDKLKSIVRTELGAFEESSDEFGTDLAFFTEFEFEFDEDRTESSKDAYQSFISFVKANEERIDIKLKLLAITLAKKIAEAFKGKNKAEVNLLKNLRKDLGLETVQFQGSGQRPK